jgi:enamine deaminase RidA (YjgF/YER057c/UK114 family)
MSEIEHIRPDGLANNPAYTHVVAARGQRLIHVSGQVAVDADGNTVGGDDLEAQTEQVMRNLGTALEAAGAGFGDVVKLTTYVVGYRPEHRPAVSRARSRFLPPDRPPASTLIGVTALADPAWLVEIEAVAVTD